MKLPEKIEWSKIKKEYILIALVIGAALMIFAKTDSGATSVLNTGNASGESILDFAAGSSNVSEISDYLSYMKESMTRCLAQMRGVGKAEVFLTVEGSSDSLYGTEKAPVIQGVLIVAEGADDPVVVKDITEACEALFSLSVHKIKVVKMKEESK